MEESKTRTRCRILKTFSYTDEMDNYGEITHCKEGDVGWFLSSSLRRYKSLRAIVEEPLEKMGIKKRKAQIRLRGVDYVRQ